MEGLYEKYLLEQKEILKMAGTNELPENYHDKDVELKLLDEINQTEERIEQYCAKLTAGGFDVDASLLEKIKADPEFIKNVIFEGKVSSLGSGFLPRSVRQNIEDEFAYAFKQYGESGKLLSECLNKYPELVLTHISNSKFKFDSEQVDNYAIEKSKINFTVEEKQFIDLINKTALTVAKLLKFQVENRCLDDRANFCADFIRGCKFYSPDSMVKNNPFRVER